MIRGLLFAAAATMAVASADRGLAQPPATPGGGAGGSTDRAQQALDAATFVTHAASLAMLQIGAAERAADQASRPEVKDFAQRIVQDERDTLQRVQALGRQLDVGVPSAMVLEHRAVLEGLAPLTGEEFDRRYAEMQVQALEQAVRLHGTAAERDEDPALAALAAEILPALDRHLAAARDLLETVRP
jgi:putative membrane protein